MSFKFLSFVCSLYTARSESFRTTHMSQNTYFGALKTEHDLLGGLGLLVEDGFGLSTVSGLFAIVTTLTLSVQGSFTSLVLGHLEGGVLVDRLWNTG